MAEHDISKADQELLNALATIAGEEHVTAGPAVLPQGVDGVMPRIAVFPADAGQIGAVLAYANERGLAVLPVGGGTQMGLGHPPQRADIALFLTRLDRIVAHEPADMTVTVQAGMSIAALQAHLARHGQCLPYDPPLPGRATVGGIVATREAGPLRQMFRGVADRLLGIQVVTAQGKVTKAGGRVVKNVSGYEMGRLYTGSMGTLAVIVEVTFKVQPRFEAAESLGVTVPGLETAGRAVRALLESDADPLMLELIGPVESDRTPGELAARWRALPAGGTPAPQGHGALLVAGYAGTPQEVAWQLGEAERIIARELGSSVRCERIPWNSAHDAVLRAHRSDAERVITVAANAPAGEPPDGSQEPSGALTGPGEGEAAFPVTCRAHVRATEVPAFLEAAIALTGKSGAPGCGIPAYAAHAGTGVVRLHLPDLGEEQLVSLITSLREKSVRAGGFLIIEKASPDLKRRLSVFGPPRQDFFLHKAIKERMDPNRILNPGRFVGNL